MENEIILKTPIVKNQITNINYKSIDLITYSEKDYSHTDFLFQDSAMDIDYFTKQKEFIESLTIQEKDILYSYTRNGAYLINFYLRYPNVTTQQLFDYTDQIMFFRPYNIFQGIRPISQKDLTLENIKQIVKLYVDSFEKIFNRLPLTTKPLRLFRGLKPSDTYDPRKYGILTPTLDYWSTTYAPTNSTATHTFTGEDCCMLELLVKPGVRLLWVEPFSQYEEEHEIILDKNVQLKLTSCGNQKHTSDYERNITVFEFEVSPPPISPVQKVYEFMANTCSFVAKRLTGRGRKTKRKTKEFKRKILRTYRNREKRIH